MTEPRVVELRVWAPFCRQVEVELDDATLPMVSRPGGWWSLDVPGAGAGTRYRYRLDGGPGRPDPRSAWQPDGIDGPSALVDHDSFVWSDEQWRVGPLASSVLYECHIGTFTPEGTFDAAIGHLDDLVDLGVTAVEVMPVAEFGGDRGWGYDGVLLFAPHHVYGGPDGLKRFVDAAHAKGLAVVLDVVYNHFGPAGNYIGEFGPYFTDRYATPWGQALNVDGAGSDEVRNFVIDNACMWLDRYHVDGLRLDAVHAIIDQSALHLFEELAAAVAVLADRTGKSRWVIAESDRNDPSLVASREVGGLGLDAVWNDDFHHAVHALLSGERSGYYVDFGSVADVARALERVYVYGRDFSAFRDRHHGRPVRELPASRFVAYAQNHDQVGNRALGERLAALVSPGRLKVAAALVLVGPGLPMLFQGEEWAASAPFQYFTDHRDPELGQAVSDGRRHEFAAFGWAPDDVPDPQAVETWRRSVLDWSERDRGVHTDLLAWHRALIALRLSHSDLVDGSLDKVAVRFSEDQRWLRMDRGSATVVINVAAGPRTVEVPPGARLVLTSDDGVILSGDGLVDLPPDTAAVLLR